MKKLNLILIISVIFITAGSIYGELSFNKIIETRPSGFIQDFSGILDQRTKNYIEKICTYLEKKTGIEIAVVTIPVLENYSIEEAAVTLFEKWGIGKKGKDNGILLLISLNPRRIRIEVGYGLEGAITDSTAGRILDEYAIPYLKKGEYNKGILLTTLAIISTLNSKLNLGLNLDEADKYLRENRVKKESGLNLLWFILLIMFLVMRMGFFPFPFLFGVFFGGGFSDSGGFGGGFGGFGGGMSGGGGASRGF